jgi:hypothetical protein
MRRVFFIILLWFWLTLLAVAIVLIGLYIHQGFSGRWLMRVSIHDLMLFSVAGAIFCYFLSNYLTKPLKRLSDAASGIAAGRLKHASIPR